MNLITDPWLPVITQSGRRLTIKPADIVREIAQDPIVQFDLSRPDFNGAIIQFFIGLLQTCCPPHDNSAWATWVDTPPSVSDLESRFLKAQSAFNFDGDGPRFMQDLDTKVADFDPKSISALFIDEPGDQTLKFNKDLFVKRRGLIGLSYPMAAMALFTLQLNAPAGGAGHRTSLRGGGPLTTLMLPKQSPSLWHLFWCNVMTVGETVPGVKDWDKEIPQIFPWMAETRTSEKNQFITPKDTHLLQVYWAMPRRIRVDFGSIASMPCALTDETTNCITQFSTQNYGGNYGGWKHPLSPHYQKGAEELPVHPNVGGMIYRQWLGWTFGDERKSKINPAAIVRRSEEAIRSRRVKTLWAFGYDMDNMKARQWQESKIPIFSFEKSGSDGLEQFEDDIKSAISSAEEACFLLRKQVRLAWGGNVGNSDSVESEFWGSTEAEFRKTLSQLYEEIEQGGETVLPRESWFKVLQNSVLAIFDKYTSNGNIEFEDSARIIKSRKVLHSKKTKESLRKTLRLEEIKNAD
jgi:CRISPR system Cascade subunit CasA